MDPLSVTVSVATFLANCLMTAKDLRNLSPKYQHALATITSLVSETTVLGSGLAQIQQLLLINAPGLQEQGPSGVELRRMFDTALTACLITFSCLEEEVKNLAIKSSDGADLEWREKSRIVWKEEIMQELLRQIRDQQVTMGLLVQTLQMYVFRLSLGPPASLIQGSRRDFITIESCLHTSY
jgi:hypothetical protein